MARACCWPGRAARPLPRPSSAAGAGVEEDEDETSTVKRHIAADYCSMEPAEKKMLLYCRYSTRA